MPDCASSHFFFLSLLPDYSLGQRELKWISKIAAPALLPPEELVEFQNNIKRLETHWLLELRSEVGSLSSYHCPDFSLTSANEQLCCGHSSHSSCSTCDLFPVSINKLLQAAARIDSAARRKRSSSSIPLPSLAASNELLSSSLPSSSLPSSPPSNALPSLSPSNELPSLSLPSSSLPSSPPSNALPSLSPSNELPSLLLPSLSHSNALSSPGYDPMLVDDQSPSGLFFCFSCIFYCLCMTLHFVFSS